MKRAVTLLSLTTMLVMSGPPLPAQTPATGRVMKEKLAHAQGVLEALTTSNYSALQHHSAELSRATKLPGWDALRSPEYRRYSESFLRATEDLTKAANDRDLDGAVVHYLSMTMTCYQCHRYMKGARVAHR